MTIEVSTAHEGYGHVMKLAATADGIARLEAVSRQTFPLVDAYESVQAEGGGAPLPIGVDVLDLSA